MDVSSLISYIILFFAVYVQVFFLITFLEKRTVLAEENKKKPMWYPDATIIIPCFNEETTVDKTIESLLSLHYPKEKLHIFVVDDGSTDNTWNVLQRFKNHPRIRLFQKENGGKHTALNLGLEYVKTELVGCLDADSFVDKYALERISIHFADPEIMAVTPAILIHSPKNLIQWAQRAEYHMGVYFKKMLGLINAIHVAPGPFSIFRKKVFDTIGGYRKAHQTEDIEITYRMQKHKYKIANCHNGYVYTIGPRTIRTLYKQRLRWIYGFLNNTIDYRGMLFNRKYGHFAWFTVPAGIFSVAAVIMLFSMVIYRIFDFVGSKIAYASAGATQQILNFDLFFVSTDTVTFLVPILYGMLIISMVLGKYVAKDKHAPFDIVPFVLIFSFTAPFWLARSIYNTVARKTVNWR